MLRRLVVSIMLLPCSWGPCEHGNEPSGSLKCGEFLVQLNNS